MKLHRLWLVVLLGLLPVALRSQNIQASTNISALSYAQVKELFEKDESFQDVRVGSFNASEINLTYKGRYLNYKLKGLTGTVRTKLDKLIELEKEKRQEQGRKDNEEAARLGMLREVNGVIYNLMKPSSAWIDFKDARVLQKLDDAVLLDIGKSRYDLDLVYVLNLPQFRQVADGDKITFRAIQVGTYTYITKGGDDKTVRKYDCGVLPGTASKPSLVRSPSEERKSKSPLDPQWDSNGTGFFVSADGFLVTCNHVVAKGRNFAVKTPHATFVAKLVAQDPVNDLALLKVSGDFIALSISTNSLRLGDPIFTIGFPNIDVQGTSPKYTDGKVSSLSGAYDESTSIQISVPVQPGNSGGPVTDTHGAVVGVVVSRLSDYAMLKQTRSVPQNVNYAVKAELLLKFLKENGVKSASRGIKVNSNSNDVVSMVEQATAIVLVSR